MKMMKYKQLEFDSVNTNEIISDFHFILQLMLEEKEMDFETVLTA